MKNTVFSDAINRYLLGRGNFCLLTVYGLTMDANLEWVTSRMTPIVETLLSA